MTSFQIFIFFVQLLLQVPLLHCDGKGCWENKTKIACVQEILRGHDRSCLGQRLAGAKDRIFFLLVMNEVNSIKIFVLGETDWTYTEAFVASEPWGGCECETKGSVDPHDNDARKQRRQIRFTLGHKFTDRKVQCAGEAWHSPYKDTAAAILDSRYQISLTVFHVNPEQC